MYSILLLVLLLFNSFLIFTFIYKDGSKIQYKVNSPFVISLFGIFLFYIFPIFYWVFFKWPYEQLSYYDGYLEVQLAITLFLIPIFIFAKNIHLEIPKFNFYVSNTTSFFALLLSVIVVINTYYETFILGNQGRLDFVMYEADSTKYFFANLLKDYGTYFFFLLLASKRKVFIKFGYILLIIYSVAVILSFHRFAILITLFQIFIFFIFIDKIKIPPFKLLLYSIVGIFFIVGIIGRFGLEAISYVANNGLSNGKSISFYDIVQISKQLVSNFNVNNGPTLWDEVFLRLNQSRSAAAVIHNFSINHNFFYGSTFLSLIFFFIPRFLLPLKPNMAETHAITVEFMGSDFGGVNPLGSIAECYINFGFYGIFFLSSFFCIFIKLIIAYLNRIKLNSFIAFYPYMAFMMFAFDLNLSQRFVQISKGILVFFLFQFTILIIDSLKRVSFKKNANI
jgi:hypothetical protein